MFAAPDGWGAAERASEGRARWRTTLQFALTAAALAVAISLGTPTGTDNASAKGKARKARTSPFDITTRFAIANAEKPIYRSPSTKSGVLRKLAFYTPDGEALQTYRFVSSRRVKGTLWQQIDVPMRPNGQVGWVKRGWLGQEQTSNTLIVVSREQYKLSVYRRGRLIFTAPVGVGNTAGAYGTTTATPPGHFWIAEAFPSTDPFYGPWAFGTTDYAADTQFPDGSIVGIHGTNEPGLIPGDPSHGCVRLKDPDILKLKKLVGIGTAVWVE